MGHNSSVYMGIHPECLDIYTLKYRYFGALWKRYGMKIKVMRYWFADTKEAALAPAARFGKTTRIDGEVETIYQTFRQKQAIQDWTHHSLKPIGRSGRDPWREKKRGWYIVRLQNTFPCYAAAVHVKKFYVWVDHSCVCENEADVSHFTQRVKAYHEIRIDE